MALTYTNVEHFVVGGKEIVAATATFDDSYPTGGEPVVASDLDLNGVNFVVVLDNPNVTWDRLARSLVVKSAALADGAVADDEVTDPSVESAEVADETDESALAVAVLVFGS